MPLCTLIRSYCTGLTGNITENGYKEFICSSANTRRDHRRTAPASPCPQDPNDLLQLPGIARQLPALLLVRRHHPTNRRRDVVPTERPVVVVPWHLDADAVRRHGPRDEALVDDERQHHEREAEPEDALHGGAPAAVRQERAHGGVLAHAHLRHPPGARHPAPRHAGLEPVREQRQRAAGVARGAPDRPEEARPGALQPERQLPHVVRRHLPLVDGLPDGAESTADVLPEKVDLLKVAFDVLAAAFLADACCAGGGEERALWSSGGCRR